MCKLDTFSYIIYFAGYAFNFENIIHQPPLDIEMGRQNTYVAKPRSKKKEHGRQICLKYIYNVLIFLVMFWPVPYTLYMAIRDGNIIHFGRSWFQLIIMFQYYHGIRYFGREHFYENIVSNSDLMKYMKVALPVTTIISVSLSILNIVLLGFGVHMHCYSDLYDYVDTTGKVFTMLLFLTESIYSYQTFTINACVFVVNMLYHKKTVSAYSRRLNDYIKNSMDIIQKLNIIATEYSQMKDKFDYTVTCLTPFFSSLNFIGFIVIYFYIAAIKDRTITPAEITNMVMFGIVEVIYIAAIQTVNSNITTISNTISSNSVITTFFGNKRFNRTIPALEKVDDSHEKNQKRWGSDCSVTIDEIERIGKLVAKIRPNQTVNDHSPDDVKGYDHDRVDDLEEDVLDIDDNINVNSGSNQRDNEKQLFHSLRETRTRRGCGGDGYCSDGNGRVLTTDGYMAKIHSMVKQNLIASISSDQMIDWLILQGIVGDRWKTFRIFGIELTDSTLISRIFGIGVTILISAEVGGLLNWW